MKTTVFRREAIALPEEDFGLVTFYITADGIAPLLEWWTNQFTRSA